MYEKILNSLEPVLEKREADKPFVIMIDGNSASGKSTLAEFLSKKYGCSIVHVDDFYFPREIPRKLGEGNSDLKRIRESVLKPFKKGEMVRYSPFDPGKQGFSEPVSFFDHLLILEGTYSLHPQLAQYADYSIFLKVDPDTQIKRLKQRDPDKLDRFLNQWLVQEREYFEKYQPCLKADWIGSLGQSSKDSIKK